MTAMNKLQNCFIQNDLNKWQPICYISNGIPQRYNRNIVESGVKHHKHQSLAELVWIMNENIWEIYEANFW